MEQPATEHHGREYIVAAVGAFAEYLAVRYGQSWLAWLAAFLLWLAVYEYTKRRSWMKGRWWKIPSYSVLAIAMFIGTRYLVREGPSTQSTTAQQSGKQEHSSEVQTSAAAAPAIRMPAKPHAVAHAPAPSTTPAQKPIEVSLNCYSEALPITVPAGGIERVVGFNEAYTKVRTFADVRQIVNTTGTGPLLWPDAGRVEQIKKTFGEGELWVYRCEVFNHGEDNVVDLQIPLQVWYKFGGQLYPATVLINPLDKGKRANFYLVNDCPVEIGILTPLIGTARFPWEQSVREFRFELADTGITHNFQLGPSHANWMSMTCVFN
jgi:hypothetical protein